MSFLHLNKSPSSVYIHYPICQHHCSYCDFNVVAKQKLHQNKIKNFGDLWLQTIERHLHSRTVLQEGKADLESLYLGGGTPSLLKRAELFEWREKLDQIFDFSDINEWSIEANPENITPELVQTWKEIGITRVSIGVQSFQEPELRRLERLSTASKIVPAIELVAEQFPNYSLDLMFGIPDQKTHSLKENLEKALELSPPHISIYLLTIDPHHKWHRSQSMSKRLPNEKQALEMYHLICRVMADEGYHHYEISNFAKPGFVCVHNQRYWNPQKSYLGLGPGAHGYDAQQKVRYENHKDLEAWKKSDNGIDTIEELSEEQQRIEDFYLHLRTRKPFPNERVDKAVLTGLLKKGFIETNLSGDYFWVSEESWIMLDSICGALVAKLQ